MSKAPPTTNKPTGTVNLGCNITTQLRARIDLAVASFNGREGTRLAMTHWVERALVDATNAELGMPTVEVGDDGK